MENSETIVNLKEIEKDLSKGLENAEAGESVLSLHSGDASPVVSKFVVSSTVVKLLCDVKNALEVKYLTSDLDEDIKEAVRRSMATTDREIKIYQAVLEQLGEDYLPEEHKALVSKILASPIILLIEVELEKITMAMKEIKLLQAKIKKEREGL